eukprot:SAG11_NODE_7996_length_1072_cov_1.130524_3_plen_56_part_01
MCFALARGSAPFAIGRPLVELVAEEILKLLRAQAPSLPFRQADRHTLKTVELLSIA